MTLITGPKTDKSRWWKHWRADQQEYEWICEHGIGHWDWPHGCDKCCWKDDYPGKKVKKK